MKVIIPCAGKGTRMLPASKDCPKVLLEHDGHPILEHIVESILSIEPYPHFIFVLNLEHGDQVIEYMRGHVGLKVSYCYQFKPLGFGHAVLQAKDLVEGEPALIHACDKVLDFDGFDTFDTDYSWMAVRKIEPPLSVGVLEVEGDYITQIIEKPDICWDAVCYIRETDLLFESLQMHVDMNLRTEGEYQMTDALYGIIKAGVKIKAKEIPFIYR